MTAQTFEYWIETGRTNGQYTLHRRLIDRPRHEMVNEYTYIRNLGRVWAEACERADNYIDDLHGEDYAFAAVKDYDVSDEGRTLRSPGKYDDDVFWFGKYEGREIADIVEADLPYVQYLRDNFDRGAHCKPRMKSLLEKFDAMELGESEQERKARERAEQREADEAAREAKLALNPQFGEGRHTIRARVLHTKWQESFHPYGAGSLKMLCEDDAGLRYWGTCPNSLCVENDDLRGVTVEFDATVEQSDDDEYFGFFKRPTKAVRIAEPVDEAA